jgi:hypothetical protein
MRCASYIDDVFEKEHESQHAAVRYLKSYKYDKAAVSAICEALKEFRKGNIIKRYERTWKLI